MLEERGRQDTFLPSACGGEQNEPSQKQPRSAAAAVSCRGTAEPPGSLSSAVSEGALFASLPARSFCL